VTNQGHVDHYREKYNNMTYEVNYTDWTSYVSYYFYCRILREGQLKVIFGNVSFYFMNKWQYLGNSTK